MDHQKALEILGLKPGASSKQIKDAYHKRIKKWHPDKNAEADRQRYEEKTKYLNRAYQVLWDYDNQADYGKQEESEAIVRQPDFTSAKTAGKKSSYRVQPNDEQSAENKKQYYRSATYTHRDPASDTQHVSSKIRHRNRAVWKALSAGILYVVTIIPWRQIGRLALVLIAIFMTAGVLLWGTQVAFSAIGGFVHELTEKSRQYIPMHSSENQENNFTVQEEEEGSSNIFRETGQDRNRWMHGNLSVTRYRNGDIILYAPTNQEWQEAHRQKKGAWCYYNNDPKMGTLYNRYAVNDMRGLAPDGWRIPTENDWEDLIERGDTGFFDKEKGGFRKKGGRFSKYGKRAYFWIAGSPHDNNNISLNLRDLGFTHEGDIFDNGGEGYSVKCVRD